MSKTYLIDHVICSLDGGEGFTVGDTYEVLEVDGVNGVQNDHGQLIECGIFSDMVMARNSLFDYKSN